MVRKILVIFILLSSIIFSSCLEESETNLIKGGLVSLLDADKDLIELKSPTTTYHISDERVIILFGYGYNDEKVVNEISSKLYEKYGSSENGGLIHTLSFPKDFKRGSRTYITNLYDMIEDKNIKGIILIGAPENTHLPLAKLQDSWGGKLPFPVISLFSQDDVVSMEDSSDFVIDKAQKSSSSNIETEEEQAYEQDLPQILDACVSCAVNSTSSFIKNSKLMEIVRKICAKHKVSYYVDPDSGIPSICHFVID